MLSRETKAIGWFLLAYVFFNLLLYGMMLLWGEYIITFLQGRSPVIQLIVLFTLQEVIILTILFLIWKKILGHTIPQWIQILRERWQRKGRGYVGKYVVGGLVIYFVCNMLLLGILTLLGREIPGLYGDQMVMKLLEGLAMQEIWEYVTVGVLVVIIGPIIEEIIFRGVITHVFMQERAFKGVVLAALVFAVVHGERGVVRNLVILSLFLGYIYWKTGSMWYSFLFHLGINGLAITVLILSHFYPTLLSG